MVDKDIEDCGLHKFDENCSGDRTDKGNGSGDKQAESGNEEGIAADEPRFTIRTLWKTGLEVFIHQLLYRRGIYPRDTFCSTRFVGVECKINNNPGVLLYIADALKETIPLISVEDDGRCRVREILIDIYDQATEITHEQFSLNFSSRSEGLDGVEESVMTAGLRSSFANNSVQYADPKRDLSDYVIGEVERDLRDLVCSTGRLERPQSLAWNDSVSFRIILRFDQRTNYESKSQLRSGLDGRKWSETNSVPSHRKRNRVLFNLTNFTCQFQYRLISMEDKIIENSC